MIGWHPATTYFQQTVVSESEIKFSLSALSFPRLPVAQYALPAWSCDIDEEQLITTAMQPNHHFSGTADSINGFRGICRCSIATVTSHSRNLLLDPIFLCHHTRWCPPLYYYYRCPHWSPIVKDHKLEHEWANRDTNMHLCNLVRLSKRLKNCQVLFNLKIASSLQ